MAECICLPTFYMLCSFVVCPQLSEFNSALLRAVPRAERNEIPSSEKWFNYSRYKSETQKEKKEKHTAYWLNDAINLQKEKGAEQ